MMEAFEKFEDALRTNRFVHFAPQAVWDAYQEGLLPNICDNHKRLPGEFLKEWGWTDEKLPAPLFTSISEWQVLIKLCALEWGEVNLIRHRDGSVSGVQRISVELRPEFLPERYEGSYPGGRSIPQQLSPKVEHRFIVLGLGNRFFVGGGGSVSTELIVQVEHYPRGQVAKVRRRIRDHIQKQPVAAVKIAKQEGLAG